MKKKKNYLNNKDLLKEIHKSKMSYCYVLDEQYYDFDIIIGEDEEITQEIITQAKEQKAKKLSQEKYTQAVEEWLDQSTPRGNKPRQAEFIVEPEYFSDDDITIRRMTFKHIPEEKRKKNPKNQSEEHAKCNFPPFKHYGKINGEWREVVRSHWSGGLENGHFSLEEGAVSNKLGMMLMKLCERYAMNRNWRGYSYVDEMIGASLVQLSNVCLYYDENKGNNPFAYYTTVVSNSFTGVFNQEKKNQNLRDSLMEDAGKMPSYSRQLDDEARQQQMRKEHEESLLRDRKDAGYNIL